MQRPQKKSLVANEFEKKMENEMETGFMWGVWEL